ncbi:MAG: RNA-binding domain-containing protein [Candidatus Hadarchaeaceae archaeon]
MRLRVEAEVKPTEAREKVEAAIKRIFPTLELSLVGNSLVGESTSVESLARLHQLLIQQAIRDSARSAMLRSRRGNVVRLMLNRQVAFVGKVSFTGGESPLGPIVVTLDAPDIERLIDYLAPRTREGKPARSDFD